MRTAASKEHLMNCLQLTAHAWSAFRCEDMEAV